MRGSIRIGRLFGIELRVDFSWTFVFLLIVWNLTAAFLHWHPNWSVIGAFVVAVIAALLFFASVLAHELAHSVVARSQGIQVRNITLFLFGGVSNFEREPHSAKVEFLSAIVGPLTSFVLGVIFFALGGLLAGRLGEFADRPAEAIARLGPAATLLLWLGPINILVGLFNLIPGFPLDGGRVLRSILWAITKDLRKATRWAAGVGQAVAWTFIVMGISMAFGFRVPFFGTGLIAGLWLAFIGWFLNNAASMSYQQLIVREVLEGVSVSEVMRRGGPAVSPEIPISELVDEWIMRTEERSFPVIRGDRLVGMVSLEDVRRVPRSDWHRVHVAEIMTPEAKIVAAFPEENVADALARMIERDVQQLPVVKDGRVVGLLRRRDVARWLELQSDLVTEGMRRAT